MGTFYAMGIIHKFKANSNNNLTKEEWIELLNKRVDLDLFDVQFEDNIVEATLRPEIFTDNISDFYEKLKEMSYPQVNPEMDYYLKEFGTDIENYQIERTNLYLKDTQGGKVKLDVKFALLFIEGKVLAEEFYTEPQVLNWLFRNSKIDNKLAGCVVSDIVG